MSKELNPLIRLQNGRSLSVQASRTHKSIPQTDHSQSGYTHYEVGCFCHKYHNAPYMAQYEDWGVYSRVPKELVLKYIKENGGILEGCLP